MRRHSYWTIIRTVDGWHLRLTAANGRIVLVSEVYESERAAQRAAAIAWETTIRDLVHVVDERPKP